MANNQILITLQEAADLGYGSVSTLRRRIHSGALPATKLRGCKYRVRIADLEALAAPVPHVEGHGAPREAGGDGHE